MLGQDVMRAAWPDAVGLSHAELGCPAPRPANSVLRSERGAPELPSCEEGLDAYMGVRA